jgi:PIN domain nuclease of toxin-antitoxin system
MNGAPMSQSSRDAIRTAQKARLGVFVSPITGWEIATLVRKSRIQLNRPPEVWFNSLLNLPGVRLTELSPAVLIASAFLPGDPPRDPADRIISATARAFGYTVITRDGKLISYAAAGHIETIRC